MSNPEELCTIISKGKILSKVDLSKGHWQVPMAKDFIPKTAFATPDGQYAFRFMPFGLVNSSQAITRMMCLVFTDVSYVINYIDVLVSEHMRVLEQVLSILEKANLTAKPSKCFLLLALCTST